jgi:hypothetical protein
VQKARSSTAESHRVAQIYDAMMYRSVVCDSVVCGGVMREGKMVAVFWERCVVWAQRFLY